MQESPKLSRGADIASERKLDRAWYAVQVRTRVSKVTATALEGKGYQVFLPVWKQSRQWSDRVKRCERLLFPGYVFCRFDPTERLLPILTTPGVLSIICAGRTPAPIPDEEIAAIEQVVRSGLEASPWTQVPLGTRILIEKGPLAGIEGVTLNMGKGCRLIVSVELLRRSVMVEIDREWARRIDGPPAPKQAASEWRAFRAASA
jgi:transcription antitermination factor NusG